MPALNSVTECIASEDGWREYIVEVSMLRVTTASRKGLCGLLPEVIKVASHQHRDGQTGCAAGRRVQAGSGQHRLHLVTGSCCTRAGLQGLWHQASVGFCSFMDIMTSASGL